MTSSFRTASGGRIDRARSVRFTFDGQGYLGCAGDTLASALLANGVHLLGRSFKYHRPRGLLSAGAEEPNALVGVGQGGRYTPNLRATQVEIHDGLVAESQNRWPSLSFDVGEVNDLMPAGLFSAGFYYKSTSRSFEGPRDWARHRTRPIPTTTRTATRSATCSSSAPARPGSRRRSRRPRAAPG
jgi:sarcosine oxidase, subunit alpha